MMRATIFVWLILAAAPAIAQEKEAPQPRADQSPAAEPEEGASPAERGRYLVHHVAMCVICHSPKDGQGRVVESQILRGSPMPVKSPYPRQTWAFRAPALAGLGGFTEADIVTLLQTGSRPNGDVPAPPMPPFRMTKEDAQAVAAYLKSLR
jgi:mono/diheme cytochrome c family protein